MEPTVTDPPVRNDIELGPVTHWPTVYAAMGVGAVVLVGLAAVVVLAALRPAPATQAQEVAEIRPAPPARPAEAVAVAPGAAATTAPEPPAWKPLVPHTPPPVVPDRPRVAPVVQATDGPSAPPLPPSQHQRSEPLTEAALFKDLQTCAVPADLDAVAGTTAKLLKMSADDSVKSAEAPRSSPPPKELLALAADDPVVKLIARRADLAGLPVRGKSECTTPEDAAKDVEELSRAVRRLLSRLPARATPNAASVHARDYDPAGDRAAPPTDVRDARALEVLDKLSKKMFEEENVSIWMQMLQADDPPVRVRLTKMLAALKGRKAGVALARLALFDLSSEVRDAAVLALRERPAEEYRQTLLDGFRYPWAPVADHAAAALTTLNDRYAAEDLAKMLDLPDPAAPTRNDDGKWVKAEVVKVNHLRNCLLCHAPSSSEKDLVRGLVPKRDEPLPVEYYGRSTGDFVRADVTYLRQDFSVLESVADPGKWPEQQRFDYLVRRRELTDQEVIDMADSGGPPQSYPQREAVRYALERLVHPDNDWAAEKKLGLGP